MAIVLVLLCLGGGGTAYIVAQKRQQTGVEDVSIPPQTADKLRDPDAALSVRGTHPAENELSVLVVNDTQPDTTLPKDILEAETIHTELGEQS